MKNLHILDIKILSYLKKKLIFQASSGSVNIFVVLIIVWLSTFIADHIFYFSIPVRWFVLIVNCVLSVYLGYRFLIFGVLNTWRIKKSGDYTQLTREIGAGIPRLGDKLTNIYQLSRELKDDSTALRILAINRFTAKIKDLDFRSILRIKNNLLSVSLITMVLLGSAFLIITAHDALSVSAMRILNPTGRYELIPDFSFVVSPGDTSIINGNSLELEIKYHGPRLEKLYMEYSNRGTDFFRQKELKENYGIFKGEILNIRYPAEYQFRGVPEGRSAWKDKIISDIYNVDVKTPPAITEMQVRVEPPTYTKLPVRVSDKNLGNILAYSGSKVEITAISSKLVKDAYLSFMDGRKTELRMREKKLTGGFRITNSGSYHFEVTDKEDLHNQNPIEYQITMLDDRFPLIELIDPGDDLEIPPDAAINLLMEANDDFGFTNLEIRYQIISSVPSLGDSSWRSDKISIPGSNIKYFQKTYLWNFQMLDVGYGDAIKYYITVFDNDRINGPKQSKTRTFQIRFPTLDQLFSEFDNRQDENLDKTDEIAQDSEELKKKIEEIRRELKREKSIDWDQKKELESIIDKQKQIEKKISEIDKALEETLKKMEKSQLLSPEVLRKYQQLQELFRDLMTPELAKSLEELQKSLENLDKKQVDKSLADFQINQEEFQKNVERTLELFKKVKLEQELDRLAQLSKHMLELQREMTNSLNHEKSELQASKNNLERKTDQQKSSLEQIENSLKNLANEPMISAYPETDELLQKAAEDIAGKNISGRLNDLQQQISQNNQQLASQNSQKLVQDLEMLNKDLDQAKKMLSSQARHKIIAHMQRATDNLLSLSKSEEEIIRETKSASGLGDQMRNIAAQQQKVADNASRVFQEIVQLSHETFALPPELGRALGKANYNMQKSISELEQRNQRNAGNAQVEAMTGLNEAVIGMQQAMSDIQSADSPFGMEKFMEQLMKLCQGQCQINKQSLGLMEGQGGKPRLSEGDRGKLRRLAAEQRAIQESLEQMHENDGDKNVLGRLGKITEDMEEVLKDLEALKIDRHTIDRQERILTRMLDAQKSVREREYSKERKAEIGKEYTRKSPGEDMDTEDKRAKKLQIDLLRALNEGYNPDYEKLIEEYFKTLNQEYLKD